MDSSTWVRCLLLVIICGLRLWRYGSCTVLSVCANRNRGLYLLVADRDGEDGDDEHDVRADVGGGDDPRLASKLRPVISITFIACRSFTIFLTLLHKMGYSWAHYAPRCWLQSQNDYDLSSFMIFSLRTEDFQSWYKTNCTNSFSSAFFWPAELM